MAHTLILAEHTHTVALSRTASAYCLHWNDQQHRCHLHAQADGSYRLMLNGRELPVHVAQHGDAIYLHLDGCSYHLQYQHPLQRLAQQQQRDAQDSVRAPMPGSVITVEVTPGENVMRGQIVLVIESMKMQTTLIAPRDGVVAQLACTPGQTFERDAILLTLAPQEAGEFTQELPTCNASNH